MAAAKPTTSPTRARLRPAAREAVLEAASQVFVERGFEGASIDVIAQRAGVSKPTIYSHFSGKEGLFVEILGAVCDSLSAPMVEVGADAEDLEAVLQRIALAYARAVLTPKVVALHRLFVAEAERFPALSRRYHDAGPERAHRALAQFLAARMAKCELRPGDPLVLAEIFAAMVLSPIRTKLLFTVLDAADDIELQHYSHTAVSLFMSGCRIQAEPEDSARH